MEKHVFLSSLVLFSPITFLLESTAHMGSVGPCFCNSPFLSQYLPAGKKHRPNKHHKISCSLGCPIWDISVLAGFQKMDAFCLLKNWFPNAGQQRLDRTGFSSVLRFRSTCSTSEFYTPGCKAHLLLQRKAIKQIDKDWARRNHSNLLGIIHKSMLSRCPWHCCCICLHVGWVNSVVNSHTTKLFFSLSFTWLKMQLFHIFSPSWYLTQALQPQTFV